MGSLVSPIVANLYMEHFEQLALSTAPVAPRVWKRYVDDTFTICPKDAVEGFTDHLNNISTHIKFTRELEKDSSIAFLDSLVKRNENGTISVSVYRKPTHTNQYLNFDSHHPLNQKLGVVHTLYHRCESIVTTDPEKTKEKQLIAKSLTSCGYPKWTLREKKSRSKKKRNNITRKIRKRML